jgi:hypothetical protein
MTDAELRADLLSRFYELRHSNGGFVPVTDIFLSGTERVTSDAIGGVCRQLREAGLIEWTVYLGQGPIIGSARITGAGVDIVERRDATSIDVRFSSKPAPVPNEAPLSDEAVRDIRQGISRIKAELPAVLLSNSANAEITADINHIEIEADRPVPRRLFMKLYLESLRDNLAKASGAATAGGVVALVALIGGLIAKHFGVL